MCKLYDIDILFTHFSVEEILVSIVSPSEKALPCVFLFVFHLVARSLTEAAGLTVDHLSSTMLIYELIFFRDNAVFWSLVEIFVALWSMHRNSDHPVSAVRPPPK
jgi:hypothetical protein